MFKSESKSILFSKENILISLFVSTIFCLFIISGENSLEGLRFTKSHDGVMIQKTTFDLINHFSKNYDLYSEKLESGKLYLYSIADFYKSTIQLMREDIFAWLEHEPSIKPYRI